MTFPRHFFYAQPIFHIPDAEAARLLDRIENGKGSRRDFELADAFTHFGVQAYFTQAERDAALAQRYRQSAAMSPRPQKRRSAR